MPIIEKAYAKLHNNYQSLISGDIGQGLADLTGGVADKAKIELQLPFVVDRDDMAEWERKDYKEKGWLVSRKDLLKDYPATKDGDQKWIKYIFEQSLVKRAEIQDKVDKLWKDLKESFEKKCLMGCSAEGEGFI